MCFDRGNFVVRDLSKYLRGGKISRHWKRSEFANPATDSSTDRQRHWKHCQTRPLFECLKIRERTCDTSRPRTRQRGRRCRPRPPTPPPPPSPPAPSSSWACSASSPRASSCAPRPSPSPPRTWRHLPGRTSHYHRRERASSSSAAWRTCAWASACSSSASTAIWARRSRRLRSEMRGDRVYSWCKCSVQLQGMG